MTERLPMDWEKDRQLVEQAKQDPSAFGGLYERYVDRIYSFFIHWGHNQDTAEDLTSATFLNAFKAFPRFTMKHDYSFAGWIFRIARNNLYNQWRDNKRHPNTPLSSILPDNPLFSQFSDPTEGMEKAEKRAKVRQAFDKLLPRERIAIYLHIIEGLPNKEVGQIIGRVVKTEGVAKAVIRRGLKKLRQELEEE